MTTLTYSWGEFYETMRTCDEYTEEIQKKFAIFEALDKAVTIEEIKEIIKPLTENEINWLNSPCLDGIILGATGEHPNPIRTIIRKKKDNVEACKFFLQRKLGKRCLNFASYRGMINIVTLFLDCGADIESSFDWGRGPPLSEAAKGGKIKTVKLLLERGANIRAESDVAFGMACRFGRIKIAKLLIEKGADIFAKGNITEACSHGRLEIVKLLIEKGVDINMHDEFFGPPLAVAAGNDYLEIVKFLLEKGADIHANNNNALRKACRYGKLEIVKLLLENGANVHVENECAIWVASINGRTEVMRLLIENGANVHARGDEMLHSACREGRAEIIELLMDNGVVASPIMLRLAIKNSHAKVVKLLLERGVVFEHMREDFQDRIDTMKVLSDFFERTEKKN